ncbi:hypothetical protein N9924_00575 [bacterium]|nr:hypothetical protein [bacterium]
MCDFSTLLGKTLVSVENRGDEELIFTTTSGKVFMLYHPQDCCEYVSIEDICGDLNDLVGSPILRAEENESDDPEASESGTWTYYKLDTAKGDVVVRWYGSSNGYYSESVYFTEVK